jgi:hypothetical protein
MFSRSLRRFRLSPPEAMDPSAVSKLFPPEYIKRWPSGYRPCEAVAYYMYPKGIPLEELIDARRSIVEDETNSMQKDFAADNRQWLHTAFEDLVKKSSDEQLRMLKKVLNRERLPSEAEVLKAFGLKPRPAKYHFTSFARTQETATQCIAHCRSRKDTVKICDFPTLQNLLHMSYDSMTPMKYVTSRSLDDIFYTKEFVTDFALELREKFENLDSVSKNRPILTLFGKGRLAAALNDTGILPVLVKAAHPKFPRRRETPLPGFGDEGVPGFFATFPFDTIPVDAAIQKYEPSMIVCEPHVDQDWTAEMRGYYTVRELYMVGQADSPAMGSFSYPWLSWGVTPGPETYWMYTENFRRISVRQSAAPNGKVLPLPMDPPHVLQGYQKEYRDELSKLLIGGNDTDELPYQYRVVRFHRVEIPVLKSKSSGDSAASTTKAENGSGATAAAPSDAPQERN